jgi:hypothetical protein
MPIENPRRNSDPPRPELPVILKTYDLVFWACHKTEKFPRNHKFTLGSRIETTGFELLECLIDAKFSNEKSMSLSQASTILEKLRFMFRMAKDLRLISVKSHEYSSTALLEIGRQLGSWRAQQQSRQR